MRPYVPASRLASFAAALLCACSYDAPKVTVAEPDPVLFETSVYPLLLRDCGFSACHGNTDRWFRVYGPGRTRLSEQTENYDPPTAQEIAMSYASARASLQSEEGVEQSWFLHKPLDSSQGGAGDGHEGLDEWGHNVYRHEDDVAYQTLLAWARSRRSQGVRDASVRGDSGREAR